MNQTKIAVVVRTASHLDSATFQVFLEGWRDQFNQHDVELVVVQDGDNPTVHYGEATKSVSEVMRAGGSNFCDLIFNRNNGVRNLGFAFVARFLPEVDVIVTLDEDVLPRGDTIGDHLKTLEERVPLSWMSTASRFLRGFPYDVRSEAPVMVSHGIGNGANDPDAPTQLGMGQPDAIFYKGPIPKGIYTPIWGMNLAFRRQVLEHFYFAPMGPRVGMNHFADIWMGIFLKRALDEANIAIYSGGATVHHEKTPQMFGDLQKQVRALHLNETLWQGDESDPYFTLYAEKRERWADFCACAPLGAATSTAPFTKYGPGASVITDEGIQPPGHVRPHQPEGYEKGGCFNEDLK